MTFPKKKLLIVFAMMALTGSVGGLLLNWLGRAPLEPLLSGGSPGRTLSQIARAAIGIEAAEKQVEQSSWAKEAMAEECGRTFENLWDAINQATNKLAVAANFDTGQVILGDWRVTRHLPHKIAVWTAQQPGRMLLREEWPEFVRRFQDAGWELETVEFRHNTFDCDALGHPVRSVFYFSANLASSSGERATLSGDLIVTWQAAGSAVGPILASRIDATGLVIKSRFGKVPFKQILNREIEPDENSSRIDPLIVYDLDGDGVSEIILAAKNLLFRRQPGGFYSSEPFCRYPPRFIASAVIGDFDGDGFADFLCIKSEGLFLYRGSPTGKFDDPPRKVWSPQPAVQNAMVMTCGDVDGDGDMDIFLAQYEEPYQDGILPSPYFDANDGYPAYLLANDGKGNFEDITGSSGLLQKRRRRSYSASLASLGTGSALDLVVVSDFAGLDVYKNNGHGRFSPFPEQAFAERHSFGMSHALADFNRDGRLDLLMAGMTSATVQRLDHLNLWRSGISEESSMRARMTSGTRLYLSTTNGSFEENAMSHAIAHSGWSWGCGVIDFDNDGFPDVYLGNGLESNQSVRDYESEYWVHDRYVGMGKDREAARLYFRGKFGRTRAKDYSYGGYEKNRLYMNGAGTEFNEVGHLFGVALESDTRNVVADDLDEDGRVDLILTTLEIWPKRKQTLQIYRNSLQDCGNWVGFKFREKREAGSPVGAIVTIHYEGHTAVRQIVTGDSYRSQHPNTVHFGIGASKTVESVDIHWINGDTRILKNPTINEYHVVE